MTDDRRAGGHAVEMVLELELKILLVGAPKSGKTSLVRRLCDKPFLEEYVPTLGFDVIVVPFGTYQGRPVMLHLWDVAGSQLSAEPCHHALVADGADGVLYVMDVTSRESLQAVDDWDRVLSNFLPPPTCKLLLGHKADLPVYVVNGEALSMFVKGALGFKGWYLTVGSSEYGDYDVAARRGGGGGAAADVGGRHKGQSLSGEKQLSVSEAVRTLIGHVFRARGARNRPVGVLGLGASPGGAAPFASSGLDDALETVILLGLGCRLTPPPHWDDQGVGGSRYRSGGDGKAGDRGRCDGMRELLERGRGPDCSWWQGAGGRGGRSALKSTASADPGWRYFAGRLGREEAEALLRGRPEGTFFLRRKCPSVLVLSYVAKSLGNSGSGRKSLGSTSPRDDTQAEGSSGRGVSVRGRGDGGGDGEGGAGGHTPVQHALLVHEGGFFSDEKGRLGRFPTLEELLKSKISALARYPLSFRRERGRYVLIDPAERNADPKSNSVLPQKTGVPSTVEVPPATTMNPFALTVDTSATALVRGAAASSLVPVVTGDLFGERQQNAATTTASVVAVPLPPPTPPLSTPGSSPRVKHTDASSKDGRGPEGGRGVGAGGDWVDRRSAQARTSKSAVGGVGGGIGSSSVGGSLWMEAAAAVQKSAARGGVSGSDRRALKAGVAGGGVGVNLIYGAAGRASPDSGGDGSATMVESRRYFRKGSASSTDDGVSVSSSAAELSLAEAVQDQGELGLQQHRRYQRRQQRRSGELSTMAVAAEAAVAMSAARSHPDAKRVEERVASAEASVNRAVAVLERQCRSLGVVRHQSPRRHQQQQQQSPLRQQSSPRLRVSSPENEQAPRDRARSSSAFSSPRASASPTPRNAAEENRPQRWSVVAPEGAGAAAALTLLGGAAVLLMERAWVSRRGLLGSTQTVREQAVALAVAETSGSSAGGDAPASQGSPSPPPPVAGRPFFPGVPLSSPVLPKQKQWAGGGIGSAGRQEVTVSAGEAPAARGASGGGANGVTGPEGVQRKRGGSEAATGGRGVLGLSCCRDFDRVLGGGATVAGSADVTSPYGCEGFPVGKDALLPTDGLGRGSPDSEPVSDVSVWAVSSSPRIEQRSVAAQSGGFMDVEGVAVARERRHSGSASPTLGTTIYNAVKVDSGPSTSWSAVFSDVAAIEERCRGFVSDWEAARAALRDAWEDDVLLVEGGGGGGDTRGLTERSVAQ